MIALAVQEQLSMSGAPGRTTEKLVASLARMPYRMENTADSGLRYVSSFNHNLKIRLECGTQRL